MRLPVERSCLVRIVLTVAALMILFMAPIKAYSAAGKAGGVIIDRQTNRALSGVTVGVYETREIVVTDDFGRFFLNLTEGKNYTLLLSMPGYKTRKIPIKSFRASQIAKIYLDQVLVSGEEIVVTAKKDKPNISRRTVKREELKRVPGAGGDIMRTIQALPGVATASDFSGELYVRGNGPYDNKILFDKFWLPQAYHFGGFVSVINSDFIDSIDFYSGGFPVYYGEATGAILEISSREKLEPTWGGKINVNLLTADAVLEAPFLDNGYILLSGRRSYFDLYAKKMISEIEEVELSVLPVFWDYQAKIGYYFTKSNLIELLFYGSGDKIGLTFRDNEKTDVDFANKSFDYGNLFHGQGITWKYTPSRKLHSSFKVGGYEQKQRLFFGEYLNMDLMINGGIIREDLSFLLSKYLELDAGAEYLYAALDLDAQVPVVRQGVTANPNFPEDFNFYTLRLKGLSYHHYSSYLQGTVRLSPVKWVLGGRYDLHKDVVSFQYVSPRTSLEFALTDRDRITLATGLFQQAHDIYFTNDVFGNQDLTTSKAIHYVAGYAHDFDSHTSLSLEGYYKRLWDLIVSGGPKTFDDNGTGRVYGGEVLLRRTLTRRFFGWFSYGYSVSKRNDQDDKGEYFFDYDRTHIVNIIASYKFNHWFQMGAKWRYATGLPTTAVVGSRYDPAQGEHFPLYSDDFNGSRLPAYHKLDIRFDFFTKWFGVDWDFYLEVLNAYNNKNIYQRDFNQREPYSDSNPKDVRDLPFLPYFGVEVRF